MTLNLHQLTGCIIISIMFTSVVALLIFELARYKKGRAVISGRQLIIRMIGGVFTLFLLAEVFEGILYFQADNTESMTFIHFWMNCLLIAILAISVALIDFIYVWRFRRMNRHSLRSEKRRIAARSLQALRDEYMLHQEQKENK